MSSLKFRKTTTPRGFKLTTFKDLYDTKCSIQKSSLADEDAIWLGVSDPNPQILHGEAKALGIKTRANSGWVSYPIPKGVSLKTRMHLTREQVADLIPVLKKFVDTGEL